VTLFSLVELLELLPLKMAVTLADARAAGAFYSMGRKK